MRINMEHGDNMDLHKSLLGNRPFPSSPGPLQLFQNEGRCSAFDVKIIFHSHANKTHFHKKGCAPSLVLKVRVFETRKWPIAWCKFSFHEFVHLPPCGSILVGNQQIFAFWLVTYRRFDCIINLFES